MNWRYYGQIIAKSNYCKAFSFENGILMGGKFGQKIGIEKVRFFRSEAHPGTILVKVTPPSRPYTCLPVSICSHTQETDTIQVVEHEPNFSQFYPLTISFLVSQFCTLEKQFMCIL